MENQPTKRKFEIVWGKIYYFLYLHLGALYGIYLLTTSASWITCLYTYFLILLCSQGIGPGTHRLWSHRCYKAKLPLRILLAFEQTLAFQTPIYNWVRDHRVHHKYSDSDFDPHDARRGFFYSHIGWLMVKRSKEMIQKGKELDDSDLKADPVVMFQKKYYWYITPIVSFLLPALIPWYFWNESFSTSWHACTLFRIAFALNGASAVNSFAHLWGNKPYDKHILPGENTFASIVSFGEGYHNYHHAFPWDYKAAELGNYRLNFSTAFLDFMATIGWAYDLKSVSTKMILKRIERTGDGTWNGNVIWGWGDKDMKEEEAQTACIKYPEKDLTNNNYE